MFLSLISLRKSKINHFPVAFVNLVAAITSNLQTISHYTNILASKRCLSVIRTQHHVKRWTIILDPQQPKVFHKNGPKTDLCCFRHKKLDLHSIAKLLAIVKEI